MVHYVRVLQRQQRQDEEGGKEGGSGTGGGVGSSQLTPQSKASGYQGI